MFPILFSFGPIVIATFNIFLFLGLILGLFLFWRKSHTEHYEDDVVFDGIILSSIVGIFTARISYILFHFSDFGFDVVRYFAIFQYPGFLGVFGYAGMVLYFVYFAKKHRWDWFELLDFGATGLSLFLGCVWLGKFFGGSDIGNATSMPFPIGMVFPNTFEKRIPIQLVFSLSFFIASFILMHIEKKYRFFMWYRGKKHTAYSGFVFSLFLITYGFFHAVFGIFKTPSLVFYNMSFDIFVYAFLILLGFGILYFRSGRKIMGKNPLV